MTFMVNVLMVLGLFHYLCLFIDWQYQKERCVFVLSLIGDGCDFLVLLGRRQPFRVTFTTKA